MKMRIVRGSASAWILFAFFVDYFPVPLVRIAKSSIADVLRSILCMALWSPVVVFMQISGTLARLQSLTFVRSAQKRKTRADADADADDDDNGEDVSNALDTSITIVIDRDALAEQKRFI
jgi:hypothetical protein